MAKLNDIVEFLNKYLETNEIRDASWNGLQVEGKSEVKKIAFAVDASIETFEKAAEEKADMVVVHHGLFWKTTNPAFVGVSKKRIELLHKNGISLYASHIPLDKHRIVGNNAELVKLLGAKIKAEFAQFDGQNIGWIGEFKDSVPLKEIEKKLRSELGAECITLPFGKEKIKTVAVCSGGGSYTEFFEAIDKKADLFLAGDRSELYVAAKDNRINVIFAGHYATEIPGVKALSGILKKKFRIKTVFIDIPTGL